MAPVDHPADLAARLSRHVSALTAAGPRHPENPSGVIAARAYLVAELEKLGYAVEQEQYGDGAHQVNLVVEAGAAAGDLADLPILEIGAHWDSVAGSPGADDNASGVAGLLEIARALAEEPPPARRSHRVRLCFFAEEEVPGFPGAAAHLERATGRGERIEGAIVLEMIGYRDTSPGSQKLPGELVERAVATGALPPGTELPDRGDFVAAVGDPSAQPYLAALVDAAASLLVPLPLVPLPVPAGAGDAARSDHARYWEIGAAGLMVTDTANFRNPHYHQPSDRPQTLDLDFAVQVTTAVLGAARTLVARETS